MTVDVVMPDEKGEISVRAIREKITDKTRLVIATHVSNVTGGVTDINAVGALCKQYNVPFLADCAQSAGHLKIDMQASGMTFLCTAGHKGLHGPQGTGFLCYSKDLKLEPLIYGGTGTSSLSLVQPAEAPEGFEAGTLNTAGIGGLSAGIRFTLKHKEEIVRHINALSERLTDGLKNIPDVKIYTPNNNGVVSFNIGVIPSTETADLLDSVFGIATRAGIHCAPLIHRWLGTVSQGAVRASIDWKNTASDIDRLVYAVSEIASGRVKRNY